MDDKGVPFCCSFLHPEDSTTERIQEWLVKDEIRYASNHFVPKCMYSNNLNFL